MLGEAADRPSLRQARLVLVLVLVLAGAGRDGAGVVPAPGVEVAAWLLGVEDAPGGAVDPHPAARPAATASTARPRSDRMVITPSWAGVRYLPSMRQHR